MKRNTKIFCAALALVIVFGAVVGGTLAYLMSVTDPVVNTFTAGKVAITLTETDDGDSVLQNNSYKMIPGNTIPKDPKVTVVNGSEASYVFIKIEEGTNNDEYITWDVADGWTPLVDNNADGKADDGVYYRTQDAVQAGEGNNVVIPVIEDNEVNVIDTVTAEMMDAVATGDAEVSLTFTAYAIQQANIEGADEAAKLANAWDQVSNN